MLENGGYSIADSSWLQNEIQNVDFNGHIRLVTPYGDN